MKIVFIISFVITCLACHKSSGVNNDPFVSVPVKVELRDLINEASGIADSEKNPGNLWVEEDSGNPPQLILLGHDGTIRKKIPLKGATNRDWEDVALSAVPGRQGSFLFIAETGDNGQLFPNYLIYRFPEPFLSTDTITQIEKIDFTYPDGSHDAEAILPDINGDIYIITKRDAKSKIYRLTYPQSLTTSTIATFVFDLPFTGVVSAALSPDGKEILLKTYTNIYYFKRNEGASLLDALKSQPVTVDYVTEPLGEAIAFGRDGKGIYTLSEKGTAATVNLFYYQRK